VAEAIAAKTRAKRIGDAVQRLRQEIERLREELARLRGDSTANTQAATVYKFPGYISDKAGPLAESPSIAPPGRGTDADPLGVVFGKRDPDEGQKSPVLAAAPPAATSPPISGGGGYGGHRTTPTVADKTTLMLKPVETEATPEGEAVDPDENDVTWRRGRDGIGFVEGIVFPVLFFGGLILAAVGFGLSLVLQSWLAGGLAVGAVMVALAGLAVRMAVRRQRERALAALAPFEKPEDVDTDGIPENIAQVYTPPVEDIPEPVDEKTVRAYEALIAEKERQLRLQQEEQWQADEEAARQRQPGRGAAQPGEGQGRGRGRAPLGRRGRGRGRRADPRGPAAALPARGRGGLQHRSGGAGHAAQARPPARGGGRAPHPGRGRGQGEDHRRRRDPAARVPARGHPQPALAGRRGPQSAGSGR
jgi:hypothetical protein